MYTLILQNNASNEFSIFSGLTNASDNNLYVRFDDIDLGLPDGEYTYLLFICDIDEVEYSFKNPILDSDVKVEDDVFQLRDLCPVVGLMRIGEVEDANIYDNKDTTRTFYYEG